jgi:dienelactone hydrolase
MKIPMKNLRISIRGTVAAEFAALLLLSAFALPPAGAGVVVERCSYPSGGVKILVDVYHPSAAGLHLPVLVLNGAGGMLFDGPEMTRVSQRLASAGFEVYQVHYFDRTHTWFARQTVLLKLFPTWLGTVRDAVDWLHARRSDTPKIGIFGYSLGAFAAIEIARRDPTIGAVVEEAGGFWHGHPEGPTRQPLPPVLVIHGTRDTRVPYEKYTKPLIAFLCAQHDPFEKKFYLGQGHDFSAAAAADVREQAVKFFTEYLAD